MSLLLVNANTLHIPLADGSVHMALTSPPYWGLRSYAGTATWEGGDAECDHKGGRSIIPQSSQRQGRSGFYESEGIYRDICGKCGAHRIDAQLGLEKLHDCLGWATGAPCGECFICHCRQWAREVWRVLRDDGTFWLNIGSSYAGGKMGRDDQESRAAIDGSVRRMVGEVHQRPVPSGLKPKDDCLIPQRLALALQADGWFVRSEIIWAKPNPMPESVTDRPTKSHETVWLLAKAQRYYYDQEAVREESEDSGGGPPRYSPKTTMVSIHDNSLIPYERRSGRNRRDVWQIATAPYSGAHFACVDDATECLTSDGWKSHTELRLGEVIAAFDLKENKAKWSIIKGINRYSVQDEPMVKVLGRTIDMLLTPNHRVIIYRKSNDRPKSFLTSPSIVEADQLKPSQIVPVAADWVDDGIDIYKPLAALIGWYVTEGNEGRDTVNIYQSGDNNPQYCAEIRELLRALGANFSEYSRKRPYKGREKIAVSWRIFGSVANELLSLCPNKCLPKDVLLWNRESLEILWDALMKGDGNFREAGRQTFVQKRKDIIDMVQAIAFRLGYSTTLRKRSEGTWSLYKTEYKIRVLRSETGELISRENYTGIVWCPQTEYGTFIARRNGRVFVTGNTWPRALVEPMIKAGTSERGCCPHCGKQWERVVEQGEVTSRGGSENGRRPTGNPYTDFKGGGMNCGTFTGHEHLTTGWQPSCSCPPREPVPCTVLDPFAGSGTSLLVARQLGRNAIGLDLSFPYLHDQARSRLSLDALDAWVNGKKDGKVITDLPLFATLLD